MQGSTEKPGPVAWSGAPPRRLPGLQRRAVLNSSSTFSRLATDWWRGGQQAHDHRSTIQEGQASVLVRAGVLRGNDGVCASLSRELVSLSWVLCTKPSGKRQTW